MHKIPLPKWIMQSLDDPASSLSLSQTNSDIRFVDRKPDLLRTEIELCCLRNWQSDQLIIMKLEQMVRHWNAVLFPLDYRSNLYRSVCLFLYIKLQLEL